jgi:hypothetical protein
MRSQEIVNTLQTLKQKSLSVNSRAQVITMANGGQLTSGGGPYPVRALYTMIEWGPYCEGDIMAK